MKANQILFIGSIVTLAVAQSLDSLPECGKLCVNNMFAKARELGCADGDTACLCKNINFAFGIRDCSVSVCGAQAAAPVITYGANYCGAVGAGNGSGIGGDNGTSPNNGNAGGIGAIPPPLPGMPSDPAKPTGLPPSMTNPYGNDGQSPISTSTLVSTVTSGNQIYTTTLGFSTIYGGNAGSQPSDVHSSEENTSSPTDSQTTPVGTPSASLSTTTNESPSSTSSESRARQTAYAGLAAAAGFAALLL